MDSVSKRCSIFSSITLHANVEIVLAVIIKNGEELQKRAEKVVGYGGLISRKTCFTQRKAHSHTNRVVNVDLNQDFAWPKKVKKKLFFNFSKEQTMLNSLFHVVALALRVFASVSTDTGPVRTRRE